MNSAVGAISYLSSVSSSLGCSDCARRFHAVAGIADDDDEEKWTTAVVDMFYITTVDGAKRPRISITIGCPVLAHPG
jgi:hypothetical protein